MEVMVALAVLSIALTSIYRLQGQTMIMSGSARFYNMAPKLAQAKLAEVERSPFAEITNESGDFGTDFPGYTWTIAVEDMPTELISSEKYHLMRITVSISQEDENSYEIQTYRFLNED